MNAQVFTPENVHTVVLGPGDFHFGGGQTRISTLLGSCVSITLWHPRRRIGGMCHYMMSDPERAAGPVLDGRYASDAFALFLHEVEKAGTPACQYQAKLFGGGNMFEGGTSGALDVGARNIEHGRHLLAAEHIALIAEHVGGSGRRKLHFDLWSGDVWLAFRDGAGAEIRNIHGGRSA